MTLNASDQSRLLAVALTSRGIGYAVLEGDDTLVESGHTSVRKGDKNAQCLTKVNKLAALYRPGVLVLQDVMAKGSRRSSRIKRLHRQVMGWAGERRLP